MSIVRYICPNCGKEQFGDSETEVCYCSNCNKKIVLVHKNVAIRDNNRTMHNSRTEEYDEEYDNIIHKKHENYKYAKRIGLAIVIVMSIIAVITEDLNFAYGLILAFVVEAFYPYPDEWGIVRKAWNCFLNGIARAIVWGLLSLGIFLGLSYLMYTNSPTYYNLLRDVV